MSKRIIPFKLSVIDNTDDTILFDIATEDMDTPIGAKNIKFTQNVNGQNTLSFDMYMKYFDVEEGIMNSNPYIPYLVNERKIRLKYKTGDDIEWYDFVIKNIEENSESYCISYSATDAFINELSKNGYNIEFNSELYNNLDTAQELGKKVLDGSGWSIDEDNSDVIVQTQTELLYKHTVVNSISLYDINNHDTLLKTVTTGDVVLIPYSYFHNTSAKSLSVFYDEDNSDLTGTVVTDENGVIIGFTEYYVKSSVLNINEQPSDTLTEYKGEFHVRSITTEYDSKINYPITRYKSTTGSSVGTIYNQISEVKTVGLSYVKNRIVDSCDFVNMDNWDVTKGSGEIVSRNITEYDSSGTPTDNKIPDNFMKVKFNNDSSSSIQAKLISRGWNGNRILKGYQYVCRIEFLNGSTGLWATGGLKAGLYKVERNAAGNMVKVGNAVLNFNLNSYGKVDDVRDGKSRPRFWHSSVATASSTVNISELKKTVSDNRYALVIEPNTDAETTVYIREIQLFRKIMKDSTHYLQPGEVPEDGLVDILEYYYDPNSDENKDVTDIEELTLADNASSLGLKPVYDNDYTKKRSIEISKSNRFNIIQEICETFECWAKFIIIRDEKGNVLSKKIAFKNYIGKDNYGGFKYGINLKGIQRTVNSDQIVTKLIVPANNNEFGTDGFCTIQRSTLNPTRNTVIYNFNYFIRQGLVDSAELNSDLINYYNSVSSKNETIQNKSEKLVEYELQLAEINANITTQEGVRDAAATEKKSCQEYIIKLYNSNISFATVKKRVDRLESLKSSSDIQTKADAKRYNLEKTYSIMENSTYSKKYYEALTQEQKRANAVKELSKLRANKTTYENKVKNTNSTIESKKEELKTVESTFYNKYKDFIIEGTWESEDYYDDDLYYIDALSTLYTSSRPQTSYSINTVEVSQLDGLELYDFSVGDKTYVEDVEFFGYLSDGITPYKEEVVVSEITRFLQDPSNNTITVQNFKTQFEDLFQRITATTQTLQYAAGKYERAATLFEPVLGGTSVNLGALQEALNNGAIAFDAAGGSLKWGESGLDILDGANGVVRLSGGGIYLSTDNGENFEPALTPLGINGESVYTGKIKTDSLTIGSAENPFMYLDKDGLIANKWTYSDDTSDTQDNSLPMQYVRFGQYGVYGYIGEVNDDPLTYEPTGDTEEEKRTNTLEYIKEKGKFGLLWDGFFLNSVRDGKPGGVRIDDKDDIYVFTTNNNNEKIKRVHIGEIDNNVYGIKMKNSNGDTVFSTDNDGNLTIKGNLSADNGVFNNVVVSGRISAAVFEASKTQASGGSMIFKTAARIHYIGEDNDGYHVYQNESETYGYTVGQTLITYFDANDWCYAYTDSLEGSGTVVKQISGVGETTTSEGTRQTIKFTSKIHETDVVGSVTTLIIAKKNGESQGYLIGINSNKNNSSFLYGEGITMYPIPETNGIPSSAPLVSGEPQQTVFIGNLNKLGLTRYTGNLGYGLYADNVILRGNLFGGKTGDQPLGSMGIDKSSQRLDNVSELELELTSSNEYTEKVNVDIFIFSAEDDSTESSTEDEILTTITSTEKGYKKIGTVVLKYNDASANTTFSVDGYYNGSVTNNGSKIIFNAEDSKAFRVVFTAVKISTTEQRSNPYANAKILKLNGVSGGDTTFSMDTANAELFISQVTNLSSVVDQVYTKIDARGLTSSGTIQSDEISGNIVYADSLQVPHLNGEGYVENKYFITSTKNNWRYRRWNDGWVEAWRTITPNITFDQPVGDYIHYKAGETIYNFPYTFKETPKLYVQPSGGNIIFTTIRSITTSGFRLNYTRLTSTTSPQNDSYPIHLYVFGRIE